MALLDIYWDDTAATDGAGTTPSAPRRCATASDWTALWRTYGAPGGYTIHLAAGTYPTSPSTVSGNVAVVGAGTGLTTLTGNLPFSDNGSWVTGASFSSFTFDLNPGGTTPGTYAAIQFNAGCDAVTVSKVKVIHYGALGVACQAFLFVPTAAQVGNGKTFANILVDGCVFTSPSLGNTFVATLVAIQGYPGVTTDTASLVVSNCVFYDCDAADPTVHAGQPGAFTRLSCVNAPNVLNNYATNVNRFYYVIPGALFTGPRLIQDNRLVQVGVGCELAFGSTVPTSLGPITLRHNYFERRGQAGAFFSVTASSNAASNALGTVLIERNWIQDVAFLPSSGTTKFVNAFDGAFPSGSTLVIAGLCVRTNVFFCAAQDEIKIDGRATVLKAFSAYGNSTIGQNLDRSAHTTDLIIKLLVVNWYGAQASYYDSFGPFGTSPPQAYSVESIRTGVRYLANVWGSDFLFIPEAYGNFGMFGCARPFRDVKQGQFATAASTKVIWAHGAAAGRWESTTDLGGQKINIFPPGKAGYVAVDYANTIEWIRSAYQAGDDMMATGTSGSPSDFQMTAYIFNRIANGTL